MHSNGACEIHSFTLTYNEFQQMIQQLFHTKTKTSAPADKVRSMQNSMIYTYRLATVIKIDLASETLMYFCRSNVSTYWSNIEKGAYSFLGI